jgi:hypothetical protein
VLIAIGIGLVLAAGVVADIALARSMPRSGAVASATARTQSPVATPYPREVPVKMTISKLGQSNVTVESVGLDKNHNMDIPKISRDVAWYAPGVAPGQAGDAVIAGHKDWSDSPCSTFCHLDSLVFGDEIRLTMADGVTQTWVVHDVVTWKLSQPSSKTYDPPPPGLFKVGGPAKLSLITCAGLYTGVTYTDRLIVNAVPWEAMVPGKLNE